MTNNQSVEPAKHICAVSRTCSCWSLTLEPSDSCPVHGYPYPPRCGLCGRFISVVLEREEAT